jgi:hypothetical protein
VIGVSTSVGCRVNASDPPFPKYPAQSASAFLAGLGVNTHVGRPNSPYRDPAKVAAGASFLGLRNFRDGLNEDSRPAIEQLAARGFKFDLIAHSDLDAFMGQVRALAQAHPGSVAAIEGPNEVDGWPISHRDLKGYPAAAAFQTSLYQEARSDPSLQKVPVYNVTVSGTEPNKYDALGNLSKSADYANVHIYYGGGQPSYGWSLADQKFHWASWLAAGQRSAPGKPTVITEMGATVAPLTSRGVSEAVQAKQMLNALMNSARTGVAATYLYELVDDPKDPAGLDPESHFGLFNNDWTPKLSAKALHNFTRVLSDQARASPADGAFSYAVTGLPPTGAHVLFEEQRGLHDIVIWAEPDIWDELKHTEIGAEAHPVTLILPRPS